MRRRGKISIVCLGVVIALAFLGAVALNRDEVPDHPEMPDQVIAGYLKAHGQGDTKSMTRYLSQKRLAALNKSNTMQPAQPIYSSLRLLTTREDPLAKELFVQDYNNQDFKVFWVEWYAELTEYGRTYYTRPSGKMSWYFLLVHENGKWKIDDWGY